MNTLKEEKKYKSKYANKTDEEKKKLNYEMCKAWKEKPENKEKLYNYLHGQCEICGDGNKIYANIYQHKKSAKHLRELQYQQRQNK